MHAPVVPVADGGNVAAYLRLTYPDDFTAALASGAVVKMLVPAKPWKSVMYDSYEVRRIFWIPCTGFLAAAASAAGSKLQQRLALIAGLTCLDAEAPAPGALGAGTCF